MKLYFCNIRLINVMCMRGKKFLLAFILLILNTALIYAQPSEPCAGADPDANMPA